MLKSSSLYPSSLQFSLPNVPHRDWKSVVEQDITSIKTYAIANIKRAITRICDEKTWGFTNTPQMHYVIRSKDTEPDEAKTTEIIGLVNWYETHFGSDFPTCSYRDGKWEGI